MGLDPGDLRSAGPYAGRRSALPGGPRGAGRPRRAPPRAALAPAGRGGGAWRWTLGGRQSGRRIRDRSRALRAGGPRAAAPPRAGRRWKRPDAPSRCRGRPAPCARPGAARIHRASVVLRRADVRPSSPGYYGRRALPVGRARRTRAPGRRGVGGGRDGGRDRASPCRGGRMGSVRRRSHRATQGTSPCPACARAAVRSQPAGRGPGSGLARRGECRPSTDRRMDSRRPKRSRSITRTSTDGAKSRTPGRTNSPRSRRPSGTRTRSIWRSTW